MSAPAERAPLKTVLQRFVELGGRVLDSSPMYGNAESVAGDLAAELEALSRAVESMGAKGFGPIEQSQFLRRLGIEQRAASLKTKAARADDIDQALARLIGRERTAMGELFKVAAFVHPSIGTPPGFEASKS